MQRLNLEKLRNPIALKNGGYLRGAHHPHCDRHNHHLIWVAGHPLCLGCTCMYSGIALGVPIALLLPWQGISFAGWVVLHLLLLVPTLIQVAVQYKPYKILARTLLGITISSYFVSGLLFVNPPVDKIIFFPLLLLMFALGYRVMSTFRNRYTKSPCDDCPLGRFPVCEWNLPRLLDNVPEGELFTALQHNQIQDLVN